MSYSVNSRNVYVRILRGWQRARCCYISIFINYIAFAILSQSKAGFANSNLGWDTVI